MCSCERDEKKEVLVGWAQGTWICWVGVSMRSRGEWGGSSTVERSVAAWSWLWAIVVGSSSGMDSIWECQWPEREYWATSRAW